MKFPVAGMFSFTGFVAFFAWAVYEQVASSAYVLL